MRTRAAILNWTPNPDGTFTRRDRRYASITQVGNGGSIWVQRPRVAYGISAVAQRARRRLVYAVEDAVEHRRRAEHRRHDQSVQPRRGPRPDDNDRRHNVVADGSYLLPKIDVQLAGIAAFRSALPYSVSIELPARRRSVRGSTRAARFAPRRGGEEHRLANQQDLQIRQSIGDRVLGDVQRVQRRQLAALSRQPAVGAVRPRADRGSEAAAAVWVPFRFLERHLIEKLHKRRNGVNGARTEKTFLSRRNAR